jgi:glycosyltransferase involved in cell wall biosynthesis
MTRWHVLTVEYPPACGGVADYCGQLAQALARAGDDVTVWVPEGRGGAPTTRSAGVTIRILPDLFGSRSRRLLQDGLHSAPGIVLLQYVPTAVGRHGVNLGLCRWLLELQRAGCDVRVMVHEPYFYFSFSHPWTNGVALAHRVMAALLIRASRPLYVSTESWRRYLAPYGPLPEMYVLAIPATVPSEASADAIRDARLAASVHGREILIGHFGTYGDHVGAELMPVLREIANHAPNVRFALIGTGSDRFAAEIRQRDPVLASVLHATGRLPHLEIAAALRACDFVIQPYPDGVTTRRTSVMASLANGVPVITTHGFLTESIWSSSQAVMLVPAGRPSAFGAAALALARDADERAALGIRGRSIYLRHFALEHGVDVLRAGLRVQAPALMMAQ